MTRTKNFWQMTNFALDASFLYLCSLQVVNDLPCRLHFVMAVAAASLVCIEKSDLGGCYYSNNMAVHLVNTAL